VAPGPGEDNLLTYGDYILGLNTAEMALKPGQRVVVGPEGAGLQVVPSGPKLFTITGTTLTLTSAHDGAELTFTNASGCVVTLPNNTDQTITTKSQMILRRATGAGAVSAVAGSGATLVGPPG
jgi:hypothetical protein